MSSSWQNLGRIVAILILLASVTTCRSKDPFQLLIDDLEKAAEGRDVNKFEERLASGFSGTEGVDRQEALVMLRRYFAAYETVNVIITRVQRSKAGDKLSFRVQFSGKAKTAFNLQNLLPSAATYDFDLQVVQEGGLLKVHRAFWQKKE